MTKTGNIGESAQFTFEALDLTWAPASSGNCWATGTFGAKVADTFTSQIGLKTKTVTTHVPELALYDFDTKEVIRTIEPASFVYNTGSTYSYLVYPQASVNVTKFGYDTTNGTFICGSIIPGQYADLVESWDLYVLPSASIVGSEIADLWESVEVPATGAIKLDSQYDYPMPEMVDAADEGVEEGDNDGSIKFAKLIPASVLPDKYSYYNFFVGMKLRADKVSGSTQPIFTQIGNYRFEITTGIDDVDAGQVNVSAGRGCINISGADGSVDIFNMQGQRIYAGNDSSVPVAPGLYIVKVGEKASKLIVK